MAGEFAALRDKPFALLCAMDARLRAAQPGLAQGGEAVWTGLALQIRQHWFVVPQADVREIVPRPPLARIPGAKAFLCGMANLRGSLLPVTDLGLLAQQPAQSESRQQRVVVLNSRHIPAGFLVDAVAGYRSFSPADQRHALADDSGFPRAWMLGAFLRDAETWPVLSLQRVARSEAFVATGANAGATFAGEAG
ncbi:MAG: chemotaxis protein CheW [Sinobacteraceae bacterium]|nr:chemotaxis protein CheW [Nevskiaceae bacterium]